MSGRREDAFRALFLQGAGRVFNEIAGPNARPGFVFNNGIVIANINDEISQSENSQK